MNVEKHGFAMPISAESLPPKTQQKIESTKMIPPTQEQKRAYRKWKKRTKELIDEGRKNGWWSDGSYDESWSFEKPRDTYEHTYAYDENGEPVMEPIVYGWLHLHFQNMHDGKVIQ